MLILPTVPCMQLHTLANYIRVVRLLLFGVWGGYPRKRREVKGAAAPPVATLSAERYQSKHSHAYNNRKHDFDAAAAKTTRCKLKIEDLFDGLGRVLFLLSRATDFTSKGPRGPQIRRGSTKTT